MVSESVKVLKLSISVCARGGEKISVECCQIDSFHACAFIGQIYCARALFQIAFIVSDIREYRFTLCYCVSECNTDKNRSRFPSV